MKTLDDLLLLGDPRLYEVCASVLKEELPLVKNWTTALHEVMEAIRAKYQFGRGIAAPQLGIMKRLFYINLDRPTIVINPEFTIKSKARFEVWDDCMCFPNLLVKVNRHQKVTMRYRDENWEWQTWSAEGSVAELLQHEYDHLDGILCIARAISPQAFKWRPTPAKK